ncbi:sulfate permease 2 [Patellaria atrata CBS 101060]|uniref:Sulfate permease 2 n=1 Tax=Patellaria atrata CBS 101060 TaxID=1346257 RepID=A0A9P4SHW2_9PEZI|nr:sulfate permease 2 [Patellaria atrata CBS 101060]
MTTKRERIGRVIAKVLRIDVDYRDEPKEHISVSSSSTIGAYYEKEPTTGEWLSRFQPTTAGTKHYLHTLFPFLNWILHYNVQWLIGDLIAGITVGFVVIPQGMAYALLAQLPPEFGLYTSFVGFLLYWAFATSKDITIGLLETVAVMSTLVGNIVLRVQDQDPDIPSEEIARSLSVICGAVLLFIGLARLGWIVEFIPLSAITSFMTGAAISIAAGQVPAMMGIKGIKTREATYLVIINTLKQLGDTKIDATMGLSALFMLYGIKYFCSWMSRIHPQKQKLWFFVSTLRMVFVILLYTMISWLVNKNIDDAKKARFKILGTVPRGFQHAGVPVVRKRTIELFAPDLPASLIVLLIEHIAISKSFGRINNYTINPSQELVAVGFTNLFGPFLGGYPATGSFSRTAIKSKAGVRTPLAGIFTAVMVLLALYALTSVFYYIPMASLAGLIIHAVFDLITPPNVVYKFWEVSPLEVVIFFGGIFVTIFTNIENGIYATVGASAALLLFRLAKAKAFVLGRVKIHYVTKEELLREDKHNDSTENTSSREAFLPIEHQDGSNPLIDVQKPHPGVFIYRFSEGFTYVNQAHYLDALTEHLFKHTRRTQLTNYTKIGDRPWNDPGLRRGQRIDTDDSRPILRAVILDFSSVNNVDVTSIQGLIDIRNQFDRYAAPEIVDWHIACITNRWTKRALAAAGFGYPTASNLDKLGHWEPLYSVADIGGAREDGDLERRCTPDIEDGEVHECKATGQQAVDEKVTAAFSPKVAPVVGINRPFFHVDVAAAVHSALLTIERRGPITDPKT